MTRIFTEDNIERIKDSEFFSDDKGSGVFTSYDSEGNRICKFTFIGNTSEGMLEQISGKRVYRDAYGFLGNKSCLRLAFSGDFAAYYFEDSNDD